jgi:hypothetical protein
VRRVGWSAVLTVLLVCAVVFAVTPMASVIAATALCMGGSGHQLSIPQDTTQYIASYVGQADARFVAPSELCAGGHPGCTPVAVYTPRAVEVEWAAGHDVR